MKVNLEKISNLERKLVIDIPQETVNSKFLSAYQKAQKSANIPGFRQGKVPLSVIKQKFKEHVVSDVVNDLIKEAYVKALSDHALSPVSYPQISFDKIEEDKDFQFTAVLEVSPEIQLNKISGIHVLKEKLEIEESQIDDVIKNLLDSRTETVDSSKTDLQNGDVAMLDFEGFIDNAPLAGGKGENYPLEIGSNQFIPGFEEKLVGMKVGETRKVDLSFPTDYHAKDIAGKDVSFNVVLHKIQEKRRPELNDDFAKSIGSYENLEALKKGIRDSIEKREQNRIQDDFRKRLLKRLVEENPIEVPKTQVMEQKKLLLEDMAQRMKQQGMNEDAIKEYESKWAGDLDKTANFMVQSGYMVNELSKVKSVQVTDEDRDNKLKAYAEESGIAFDQLREFYTQQESQGRLDYQILEEKVLDTLATEANIEEVNKDKIKPEEA